MYVYEPTRVPMAVRPDVCWDEVGGGQEFVNARLLLFTTTHPTRTRILKYNDPLSTDPLIIYT